MGWPGFGTKLGDVGTILDVGLGRGAFRGAITLEGWGLRPVPALALPPGIFLPAIRERIVPEVARGLRRWAERLTNG